MNNALLEIFETNTDAFAVNRGFYYQYLMTLKKWIKNFVEDKDESIYSEVDDDIKQVGDGISFTQIKCYTNQFSFQSKEIKQSLFNYFILHLKNVDQVQTSFCFTTNSGLSKREKLLEAWHKNPALQDNAILENVLKKVKEILKKEVNNKKRKKIEKNRIDQIEIGRIKSAANILLTACEDKEALEKFVRTIRWQFLELNPETAVINLNNEIDQYLKHRVFNDRPIFNLKAVLLSDIYKCSQESRKENRLLSNQKLKELINKSDIDFQNHIDKNFIQSIGFLDNLLDQKIKRSFSNLEQRIRTIESTNADKDRLGVMPKMLSLNLVSYGKDFYGSENTFEEFLGLVHLHKRIVLCGKSGIGKTHFIQRFIEENKDNFDHIIYSSSTPNVSKAFSLNIALLRNLNIEIDKQFAENEIFQIICSELSKVSGNNLCVLDDYGSDLSSLKLLFSLSNWNFIILSQENVRGIDIVGFDLPKLTFDDAKRIYEKYDKSNTSDESLDQFFELVEFNPSIIDLSAKLIRNSVDIDLNDIIEAFNDGSEIELLNLEIDVSDEEKPVQFLSYLREKLLPQNLTEIELYFLDFIALLPSEDIQIKDLAAICGQEFYKKNVVDITNIANSLQQKGLVDRDGNNLRVTHLIQELIIFENKQKDLNCFAGSMLWIIWLYKRIDEASQSDPSKGFRYLKYAESILSKITEQYRASIYQPLLLLENALLNAYNWHESSEKLHKRWVNLKDRASSYLDNSDGNLGIILNNVGLSYCNIGDIDKSIKHYKEAILIFKKSIKVTKFDTASLLINTYSNLFFTMTAHQKFEEIDEVIKDAKKLLGDSDLVQNQAFIAGFYFTEGFYFKVKKDKEQALRSYEKAISLYKELPDEKRNNFYFITFYFSAIQLLISRGEHDKVVAYLMQIASLREKVRMLEENRPLMIFNVIDFLNSFYLKTKQILK